MLLANLNRRAFVLGVDPLEESLGGGGVTASVVMVGADGIGGRWSDNPSDIAVVGISGMFAMEVGGAAGVSVPGKESTTAIVTLGIPPVNALGSRAYMYVPPVRLAAYPGSRPPERTPDP